MMARLCSDISRYTNEPYIVAEVPVPKSLFSMVVDIVQHVGSANWVTNTVF